jgi:3-oxoacyl-[acyl-carrier protein] reductase
MKLDGRVALITGATRGIGLAIARRFAAEGAKVVLNGRNAELGHQLADAIIREGGRAVFAQGDVASAEDVKAVFAAARSSMGEVDVLVNNAAAYEIRPFRETSEQQWDRVFEVNVKGTFHCCKEALEPMIARKQGAILNLTSIAAKTGGVLPVAHYAASKAAVLCLTKSLARQLAPFGIRVNAICPGTIRTAMTAAFAANKVGEIPLARLGESEEVAAAALFLCCDESSYITGEIMDVNGGQLMD